MKKFVKKIYFYWMKLVKVFGLVNSTIIFTIIYFLLFGIYAIVTNLFEIKKYLFNKKITVESYWISSGRKKENLETVSRQF